MTQEELADRSGVSVRTIRGIEVGEISNPRRRSLQLILDAVNATTRQREVILESWPPASFRDDLGTGGSSVDQVVGDAGLPPEPNHRILSTWSRTEVGADRRISSTEYRWCIEFTEDGPGVHYVLLPSHRAGATTDLTIARADGCALTDRIEAHGGEATLFGFELGAAARVGDTRLLSYAVLERAGSAASTGIRHPGKRPVAHLVMEVSFHPAAVPRTVHRITTSPRGAQPTRPEPVGPDIFNTVHLVRQAARPGSHGFGWHW